MKFNRTFMTLASAGIVTAGLLQMGPTLAGLFDNSASFDPLFANGVSCAPSKPGAPPLLTKLILAKAETAPFQPGQKKANATAKLSSEMPPMYAGLGNLHYKISTSNAKAQSYFDQGLRLTFAFNHAEAGRAFRAAQTLDPDCAMCYWGEAL